MKFLVFLFISAGLVAQSTEAIIADAVLAAPEKMRADATVYGWDANGKVIVLRKGTNKLICLADDPKQKGFSVAAYHKDLEPFMARGRELKAEGKGFKEIFDMREIETKSGKLKMPLNGATLHMFQGNTKEDAVYRSVVYIPWATVESTGLSTSPQVPGGPWIMNPGTHRAHIMIMPPAPEKGEKKKN